ncbi:MAG: hypothetical protein AAF702_07935 [Chloroflexota bacterium]
MKRLVRLAFPVFVPLGFFGLLAVVITWPLVLNFDTMIPVGTGGDAWVHQWTFWWLKKAILEGENLLYTHLLFYPDGVSLTSHNVAWLNFALWFPLQALWGNTIAYGLMFLIIFTLNGCSGYWLAQKLTGSFSAALVAGVIYETWPYLTSQQGHPNMPIIMWMPLALLFLLRTFEERRVRDALLTGLFIALTGIGRWQLLILFGLGFGLFFLYYFVSNKGYRTRQMLLLYGLIGLVAILIMAPLGWPMLEAQLTRDNPEEIFVKEYFQGSDLLAYVIPNSHITLWRWLVFQLPQSLQFHFDRVDFIGHVTLFLAGAGIWLRWAKARPWVLLGGFYFIFALGTDFRFGNAIYSWVPMPYRWIEDLSIIRVIRYPHRFNTFMSLPVAILAAYGVLGLWEHWSFRLLSSATQSLWVGLLILLIVGEHWMFPYRMSTIDVPTWYQQLAQSPDKFGLLGLPLDHRGRDKDYMRFQMTHGKPLAQGHISRPTSDAYALLQSTPFLALLQEKSQLNPHLGDITHQLRPLAEANVGYIILHKEYATEKEMREWREWLLYRPRYEDEQVVVYSTTPRHGEDYELPTPITTEIGLIRADSNLDALEGRTTQGGTLQVTAEWGTVAEPEQDLHVCLYIADAPPHGTDPADVNASEPNASDANAPDTKSENKGVAERPCFVLGTEWPASEWSANELVRDQYNHQMSPFIPPGAYTLSMGLEERNRRVGVPIHLGSFEIEALPRVMEAPSVSFPLQASWGSRLRLIGYDLAILEPTKADKNENEEHGSEIQLTLIWQATQRMDHSYKFFVHIFEADGSDGNGEKIAQHDGVPRNWSYPTTWWEEGEYVVDTIHLKLGGENPGGLNSGQKLELHIGIYDEATGERLPGYSAQNQPLAEDVLRIGVTE